MANLAPPLPDSDSESVPGASASPASATSPAASTSPEPGKPKSALGRQVKEKVELAEAKAAAAAKHVEASNTRRSVELGKKFAMTYGFDMYHLQMFAVHGVKTTITGLQFVTEWYMDTLNTSARFDGSEQIIYVDTNDKNRFLGGVKDIYNMYGRSYDPMFVFNSTPEMLRDGLRIENGQIVGIDAPYDAKHLGQITWKAPFKNMASSKFEYMLDTGGKPHPETVKAYAAIRLKAFVDEDVRLEAIDENLDSCEGDEEQMRKAIKEHFKCMGQEAPVIDDLSKFVDDVKRRRTAYKDLTQMFNAAVVSNEMDPLIAFTLRRKKRSAAQRQLERQIRLVEELTHPADWVLDKAEATLLPATTTDAAADTEPVEETPTSRITYLNPDDQSDTRHHPSCECHFCNKAKRAAASQCPHGNRRDTCLVGSCCDITCPHYNRRRNTCRLCTDTFPCFHGYIRATCANCRTLCVHGQRHGECSTCLCPHQISERSCRHCGRSGIVPARGGGGDGDPSRGMPAIFPRNEDRRFHIADAGVPELFNNVTRRFDGNN